MNVMCVKWGTKYSAEYVNKLYSMVKRNLPTDFTFYCLTEDPSGIREEVKYLPIESDLEKWWLKFDLLKIFNGPGTNILFDLDIVIINPLAKLAAFKPDRLTVLKTQWKEGMPNPCANDRYPTMLNSSIMIWEGSQGYEIARRFETSKIESLMRYKGVDRFLANEAIEVDTLPTDIAYSYQLGAKYIEDGTPGKLRTEYEVCLFNEGADIEQSADWVNNYWT